MLLRPFPWETDTTLQLLASLESVLLVALLVVRFSSLKAAFVGARATPFLIYCWVLTVLYAATFSSFANFGLLVRQRSLVLPALFVLVAVEPVRKRVEPIDRSSSVGQAERTATCSTQEGTSRGVMPVGRVSSRRRPAPAPRPCARRSLAPPWPWRRARALAPGGVCIGRRARRRAPRRHARARAHR